MLCRYHYSKTPPSAISPLKGWSCTLHCQTSQLRNNSASSSFFFWMPLLWSVWLSFLSFREILFFPAYSWFHTSLFCLSSSSIWVFARTHSHSVWWDSRRCLPSLAAFGHIVEHGWLRQPITCMFDFWLVFPDLSKPANTDVDSLPAVQWYQ